MDINKLYLEKALDTARRAAIEAGVLLERGYNKPKDIMYKGDINLVTEYDLASERLIVEKIGEAFPDHAIIGEEGGGKDNNSPYRWYIDPLDGTTNFAHDLPFFAVSIGLEGPGEQGPEMLVGVVYEPLRQELFSAVKGGQAYVNDVRLQVSERTEVGKALLATGFPYDIHETRQPILKRFSDMCRRARGVRRIGSASLDLAYLAAGRFDGFWEQGLWPWDTAAGILLVTEAGGTVTNFNNRAFRPNMKEILASNGHLHYTMMKILNQSGSGQSIPGESGSENARPMGERE